MVNDAAPVGVFEADAGAGPFHAMCGFRECGRVVYKGDPPVDYELLLE